MNINRTMKLKGMVFVVLLISRRIIEPIENTLLGYLGPGALQQLDE